MANVTTLRAVAQPSRAPIGDFNRDRWTWLDAVQEDTDLTPSAKVLASILARMNPDGDCFPRNDYLIKRMGGTSEDTVQRAFKALAGRGWLRRSEGRGRTSKPVVTFLMPGEVVPLTPRLSAPTVARDEAKPAEPPQECGADKAADMRFYETEKAADMRFNSRKNAVSRIYTKTKQKERAVADEALSRPSPQLRKFVPVGSDFAIEWDQYHDAKGFEPLAVIGLRVMHDGVACYDLPFNRPPKADAPDLDRTIALKFATWATAEVEARHDH